MLRRALLGISIISDHQHRQAELRFAVIPIRNEIMAGSVTHLGTFFISHITYTGDMAEPAPKEPAHLSGS